MCVKRCACFNEDVYTKRRRRFHLFRAKVRVNTAAKMGFPVFDGLLDGRTNYRAHCELISGNMSTTYMPQGVSQ